MKSLLLVLCLSFSYNAMAAYPFTYSGEQIKTIFASREVWGKIGGVVDNIALVKVEKSVATYAITTTEYVRVKKSSGAINGSIPEKCVVIVDVTSKNIDGMRYEMSVTKVDMTYCPRTSFTN